MKINLWYSVPTTQWRWTLSVDKYNQESGGQPNLRDAMNDIATTVEYVLDTKQY